MVTNYGEGGGYKKGGGGVQKGRGGQLKFYPYKKGSEKVLAMLKGGDTKSFEVVQQELDILPILMGGGGAL